MYIFQKLNLYSYYYYLYLRVVSSGWTMYRHSVVWPHAALTAHSLHYPTVAAKFKLCKMQDISSVLFTFACWFCDACYTLYIDIFIQLLDQIYLVFFFLPIFPLRLFLDDCFFSGSQNSPASTLTMCAPSLAFLLIIVASWGQKTIFHYAKYEMMMHSICVYIMNRTCVLAQL